MYSLREPQKITFDKIRMANSKGAKKILVMACTGFGKTILANEIIKTANAKGNSVLFTSHRIALAEQTKEKFKYLNPSYLQGENKTFNENYSCLIATIQTLQNTTINQPKIVIIDECHYAYDNGLIQSLFDKFEGSLFICLSATPVDNNDKLLSGFDSVIADYQTIDLINLGWLVPFKCFAPIVYEDCESESHIVNHSIVENYIKFGESRKFIAFAKDKNHCVLLKKCFLEKNIKVEIIDADTNEKNRCEYLNQLKNGELKGLISIEILTAGFDEPSVSCVIMATKCNQWKKYIQCAGRGIRLHGNSLSESIANGKPYCVFLDFFGNILEHDMPDKLKVFEEKTQISKVIDRQLKIKDTSLNGNKVKELTESKKIYLKKIGKLLDLYEGKVYIKESDLQDDVNNFLNKTGFFWWRQNSGKMLKDGRWIHFASKSGLPDNTVFYKDTSLFFGLELKTKKGYLTEHQQKTLPEMKKNGVLFFICESVMDVYLSIEHIETHVITYDDYFIIDKKIHELPLWQTNLRKKLKIN